MSQFVMSKYLRLVLLTVLLVSLGIGNVWAGTLIVSGSNGNENKVALEAMGAARNYTISGANNTALVFKPGRSLIAGDMVNFNFTNFAAQAGTYYLCNSPDSGNTVDQTTVSNNTTTLTFRVNSSYSSGANLYVASTTCGADSGSNVVGRFMPVTSRAWAQVSANVTSYGTLVDTANAVNIANITRQYSTNYVTSNSTIDFINPPANGSKFATNNAFSNGANISILNGSNFVFRATDAGLTVSALFTAQDSANWQGVKGVYVKNDSANCTAGTNNAVNTTPSGNVTFTFSDVSAGNNYTLCVEVTGNTTLQQRVIKGAWDINVTGSGANDPPADAFQTLMIWTPNGYTGIMPQVSTNPNYKHICLLSNKSSVTAPVTVDIVSTQSQTPISGLQGLNVGTLPAKGILRLDFDSSITPYTYSNGAEVAGTPIPLNLQTIDRYSAQVNVGTGSGDVTVTCLQTDPAGPRRTSVVLTPDADASRAWKQ